MRSRRLQAAAVVLSLLSMLLVIAPATTAKKRDKQGSNVVPRAGVYSAEPVKPTGDFLLGTFAVVRDRKGASIVSVETSKGIYYPSLLQCSAITLPLRKEVVPVKPNGRFRVRDVRRTLDGKQVVRWTGRWVRPGKVRGKIRVKVKRCESSYTWKARRLPPSDG